MKLILTFFIFFSLSFAGAQNVGIGETNPTESKLQVKAFDSSVLILQNATQQGSNNKSILYFKSGNAYSGGVATIGSGLSFRMGFFTFGSYAPDGLQERMSILDNGNVSIGVINPVAKFSVNGTTSLNGNTTITGISTLNGNTTINGTSALVGNTAVTGDLSVSKGVFVGNSTNASNGGIRLNTANDNKLEYRENGNWKTFSKEYYSSNNPGFSSNIRNQLIINPTFEYTVPSDGYCLVTLEANTNPVLKTNGCNLTYLDNEGSVWLYSKTRTVQFFSAGSFKWHLVNTETGCTGGQSIPLKSSTNRVIYLQKNEKLTFAYQFNMFNVPPIILENWSADSRITILKVGE